MKTLLTILFLLAPLTTNADIYQSPSGVGSCLIPDDATLTSITVSYNSNPLWSPSTSCAYTFSGGTGYTTAIANDVEYGEIDFSSTVTNVTYLFDYSDWWIGPGSISYLPQNPNGEGFIAGPVDSLFWMSCANGPDQNNYNGILSLSFDPQLASPLNAQAVPESPTFVLLLIGADALLIWHKMRSRKCRIP